MNFFSATIRGLRHAPALMSALILSVLLLSGCSPSARGGLTSATSPPMAPGEATAEEIDSPDTWSGYRLYIEAMLARKAEDYATSAAYLTAASQKDPSALILKRELAVVYLLEGDKAKAMEVIDGILETNPDDADSLLLLVRIRLAERRAGQAEKLLQRVIESDPTREEAYYRLGMLQTTIGKRDKALATYLKLLEAYPYAYAGHYYAALLYKDKGETDKAVSHLEESLSIAPEFMEARLELADILVAEKKYDEAKGQYRLALTHKPGDIQASLAMALLHQALGEEEMARELFAELTQSADRWPEIYTLINQQYIERRRYSEAHRLLTGVMDAYKDNSEFNYMLGFVCEKLGDSEEAIQCFTRISPASDYYERAILFVSVQLWEQDRREEAIQTLEEARVQQPESIEILSYLASFYEEIKAYDKAEACLVKAIEINGEDPSLYFRIGVLYDKWGKSEASTSAMKKALELDPEDPNALNYLGYTYARQGINLEDAERLIKKALEHKPGDGYITDSLGWVYYQKGQYSKALSTLREAAALLPEDPVVMEHLGDALVQNNLNQEALNYYRESLKLGHEDAPAIHEKIRSLETKDAAKD
ncbi:tetratricopeptide repeat protein [Desulfoluna spongiiphila]|uniref:Flp pilus assembly protein TadD, contains TPR repeats n=1 Tax=Desulfoluna spongiiphila TaxID=419481 RepID=A0A1G5HZP5_9BACT|nr:tetratricopeptide repeat protein [Desulfoluna spongiiphila]SCY68909.1 Flp pilus assembly protein TadD, contains TPR repeats [Desulfoluna spongiiphila]